MVHAKKYYLAALGYFTTANIYLSNVTTHHLSGRVLCNMSVKEDTTTTQQMCTYVFEIEDDDENEDNAAVLQNSIQSYLGSDHEVLSLNKMGFSTDSDDDTTFQHVLKVKTNSPTYVATKLLGNNGWVREDHILFKARQQTVRTSDFENKNCNDL